MGRELRRVPIDFDWPMNKKWKGFLNPYYLAKKCESCSGYGMSSFALHQQDRWYGYVNFSPEETGSTPFSESDSAIVARAASSVERSPEFYGTGELAVRTECLRLRDMFNKSWMHHLGNEDVAALLCEGRLKDFTHEFIPRKGWVEKFPAVRPSTSEVNHWSLLGRAHDSINSHLCIKAKCEREGQPYKCDKCSGEGEIWDSE